MFFGGYNCIPGFHFSPMIWSVCSSNPFHDLNLMWNDSIMKLQCDSLLYQSPSSGMFGNFFPLFENNNSYIPNMLAQQTFAQFQMNNCCANQNLPGYNWNSWWNNNPWSNNNSNDENNGGGSGNTAEKTKLNLLKSIIAQLKKIDEDYWTDDIAQAYKDALNNKKHPSNQDKIDALIEILKGVSPSLFQKVILSDEKIQKALYNSGYDIEYKKGVDWEKELNELHVLIRQGSKDERSNQLLKITGIIQDHKNGDKNDILQVISTWNDKHHGSDDKGVLRFIANNLPNAKEEQVPYVTAVTAIADALIKKAGDYSRTHDIITKKQKAVMDASKKVEENFNKSNIIALAEKCDELYAELRVLEAGKADSAIEKKYSFLNEISSDIVDKNKYVKATIDDLKSEGFSVDGISTIQGGNNAAAEQEVVEDNDIDIDFDALKDKPATEQIKALCDAGLLEEDEDAKGKGIYRLKSSPKNADNKFYGIKEGKIVEYVGAKFADVITDGTKTQEVTDLEDIKKYHDTAKTVDRLVKEGKIIKYNISYENRKGVQVYKSAVRDGKYHRYFVIRNNKLVETNGCVSCHGWVYDPEDTSNEDKKAHISNLKSPHIQEFDESTLQAAKRKEDAEKQEETKASADVQKNIENITSRTFDQISHINTETRNELGINRLIVNGYYKDKNNQYYRYSQQTKKLVHLKDVKSISPSGVMTLNDGTEKPCREYESPYNSGKRAIEAIAYTTSDTGYNEMRRKVNSLKTYKTPEEIYGFFKGNKDGEAWIQTGFCKDMIMEWDIEDKEGRAILVTIAQKAKILADYLDLNEHVAEDKDILAKIDNIISERWEHITERSNQADALDSAISKLIERYESTKSGNKNDEEEFIDNWEYEE